MKERKSGGGIFILIWPISSVVLGIIFTSINKTGRSAGSIAAVSVVLGFWVAVVYALFRMAALSVRASKAGKRQREKDRQEGISRYNGLLHVGGLEAPENCRASAAISPSAFTVACAGREYVLELERIKDVDYQLDIDEKMYLKTSVIKGVAGAAVFGVSGAVIGSAPKTKVKREVKCYVIVSYENRQGEHKTFILRDERPNTQVCARLADVLKPRISTRIDRVEL